MCTFLPDFAEKIGLDDLVALVTRMELVAVRNYDFDDVRRFRCPITISTKVFFLKQLTFFPKQKLLFNQRVRRHNVTDWVNNMISTLNY